MKFFLSFYFVFYSYLDLFYLVPLLADPTKIADLEQQVTDLQSQIADVEGLRNRVERLQAMNAAVGNDLRAARQMLVRMAPGSADLGAAANALEEGFRRKYSFHVLLSYVFLIYFVSFLDRSL